MLVGHGYIVAMAEIYHGFEPVLAYDQAGSDRGNQWKATKELPSYTADALAVLDHLATRPDCTGKLGAAGICIGGHLAYRAAMDPRVLATLLLRHRRSQGLDKSMSDDSLTRSADINREFLMIWDRQDPHILTASRMTVLTRLNKLGKR